MVENLAYNRILQVQKNETDWINNPGNGQGVETCLELGNVS